MDTGPAAYGWVEDQRWTLARVTRLIFELFRVRYIRTVAHSIKSAKIIFAERGAKAALRR